MDALLANPAAGAILVVLGAVGAGAVVLNALLYTAEQERMRSTLREMGDIYDYVDLRDQDLLVPFQERFTKPVLEYFQRLGRRFAPADYVLQTRAKFLRAGELDPSAPDRFLAMKVGGLVAGFGFFAFCLLTGPLGGSLDLLVGGFALLLGVLGPDATLNRRVEDREKAVLAQLPDILDLLVICVEAGLGFDSALARTVQSVDEGEMSKEFSLALGEMKAGASRAEALEGVADRVRIKEVVSFVTSLRQADKFGTSIANVLREQAKDVRIARSQAAREKAQKAPVKMLGPMVLFIFPPLFLLILAPAFLSLSGSGGL